jgi:uncharacterized protein
MNLVISPKFSLPLEAVTQTFGILAKRGVGKTYTAAVMAESMLAANQPICVVDPIGVWWGLRAAADGKGTGYSIVVFGGDHADLPLDAGAGELIADLLIDKRISAVLDLSLLRKGEAIRFMEAFAERLYHRNRQALHLFLDEADAWAPQNPLPGTQTAKVEVDLMKAVGGTAANTFFSIQGESRELPKIAAPIQPLRKLGS